MKRVQYKTSRERVTTTYKLLGPVPWDNKRWKGFLENPDKANGHESTREESCEAPVRQRKRQDPTGKCKKGAKSDHS